MLRIPLASFAGKSGMVDKSSCDKWPHGFSDYLNHSDHGILPQRVL
jgi:hypothetical protein